MFLPTRLSCFCSILWLYSASSTVLAHRTNWWLLPPMALRAAGLLEPGVLHLCCKARRNTEKQEASETRTFFCWHWSTVSILSAMCLHVARYYVDITAPIMLKAGLKLLCSSPEHLIWSVSFSCPVIQLSFRNYRISEY